MLYILAQLRHESRSEISQRPVIVNVWPQAKLFADDTGGQGRDQLM